jgi:hypothetical protein
MGRKFNNLDPNHPFNRHVEQTHIDSKVDRHPFGVLIESHKARKKKPVTNEELQEASGVHKDQISHMVNGRRLEGTAARRNILYIINGLRKYGVLTNVEEANRILNAAERGPLEANRSPEDDYLLEKLIPKLTSESDLEPKVSPVLKESDIYTGAASLLRRHRFNHIRAYGPLALWQPSKYKKPEWFKPVVDYLSTHPDAQAQMVFGVPYHREYYEKMKDALSVFQALEPPGNVPNPESGSIAIRCIPPFQKQPVIPTIGMIVFDAEYVSIGFSIADKMDKIDTGWVIRDQAISQTAVDWFDKKIWPEYSETELLRTQPRLWRMCDGFEQLENLFGGQFTDEW